MYLQVSQDTKQGGTSSVQGSEWEGVWQRFCSTGCINTAYSKLQLKFVNEGVIWKGREIKNSNVNKTYIE